MKTEHKSVKTNAIGVNMQKQTMQFVTAHPLCLFGLAVCMIPANALAVTCQVPADRPSIQAAVNDVACTDIELKGQIYTESINIRRTLNLSGPVGGRAVIQGAASVTGTSVVVVLSDLSIENGCNVPGLSASASATVETSNLIVQSSARFTCDAGETDLIFADGFEDL